MKKITLLAISFLFFVADIFIMNDVLAVAMNQILCLKRNNPHSRYNSIK
jgi:hypothetical protein